MSTVLGGGTAPTISVGAVLSQVEKSLREIWDESPGIPAKARACTMNLVVVGSPDVVDRYTTVIDEVTSSIPARAILLSLDPEGASNAAGEVSAVCGVGNDATCSERIRFTAAGAICARAASIVDALRVAELPTAVVWLGRVHVSDPVFVGLASDATRVVLDTEYTSLASLLSLARWARSRNQPNGSPLASLRPGSLTGSEGTPHVADLAWTRLAAWQEMTARFFDEPRLVAHAQSVRRVDIKQASEPGTKIGSEIALMLGWLATRLDWRMTRIGGHVKLARADGTAIELGIASAPRPQGIAPGALMGVAIEAERDGVVLKGTVEREVTSGESDAVDVLVWRLAAGNVPSATEQRVRLGANRGARMLERTLHRAPHDPALVESAKFAEDLDAEGLACR